MGTLVIVKKYNRCLFLMLILLLYSTASIANPRVVGGFEAQPGAWPWMMGLGYAEKENYFGQYCGATLIHPNWAMTAAHCVVNTEDGLITAVENLVVFIGVHNLKTDTGKRIALQRIIIHPDYDFHADKNDIALLELKKPVTDIMPIDLPGQYFTDPVMPAGTAATLLGWGNIKPSSIFIDPSEEIFFPESLQQVSIPLVSNETCQNAYTTYYPEFDINIATGMLCAGLANGGKDSCQADSGGPLLVARAGVNSWTQVGIVSFGAGCAQENAYGVYTRVAYYTQWISDTICRASEIPDRPQLSIKALSSHDFQIDIDTAASTGSFYRLYYAPYPDAKHIQYTDLVMRNHVVLQNLNATQRFYLVVQSYQGVCVSAFSNTAILLPE